MRPEGYHLNTKAGPTGEPGLFYDYVMAGNGLFVRAQGPLLGAMVCIAPARVRGLMPLEEKVELTKGRIPRYIEHLAIRILTTDRYREQFLAVTWDGEYRLEEPPQEGSRGGVTYVRLPNTVMDIHSHGDMRAFFSWTDNRDEQGLRLYMVVGRLDTLIPEIDIRLGVYGYFAPLLIEDVFEK